MYLCVNLELPIARIDTDCFSVLNWATGVGDRNIRPWLTSHSWLTWPFLFFSSYVCCTVTELQKKHAVSMSLCQSIRDSVMGIFGPGYFAFMVDWAFLPTEMGLGCLCLPYLLLHQTCCLWRNIETLCFSCEIARVRIFWNGFIRRNNAQISQHSTSSLYLILENGTNFLKREFYNCVVSPASYSLTEGYLESSNLRCSIAVFQLPLTSRNFDKLSI